MPVGYGRADIRGSGNQSVVAAWRLHVCSSEDESTEPPTPRKGSEQTPRAGPSAPCPGSTAATEAPLTLRCPTPPHSSRLLSHEGSVSITSATAADTQATDSQVHSSYRSPRWDPGHLQKPQWQPGARPSQGAVSGCNLQRGQTRGGSGGSDPGNCALSRPGGSRGLCTGCQRQDRVCTARARAGGKSTLDKSSPLPSFHPFDPVLPRPRSPSTSLRRGTRLS